MPIHISHHSVSILPFIYKFVNCFCCICQQRMKNSILSLESALLIVCVAFWLFFWVWCMYITWPYRGECYIIMESLCIFLVCFFISEIVYKLQLYDWKLCLYISLFVYKNYHQWKPKEYSTLSLSVVIHQWDVVSVPKYLCVNGTFFKLIFIGCIIQASFPRSNVLVLSFFFLNWSSSWLFKTYIFGVGKVGNIDSPPFNFCSNLPTLI